MAFESSGWLASGTGPGPAQVWTGLAAGYAQTHQAWEATHKLAKPEWVCRDSTETQVNNRLVREGFWQLGPKNISLVTCRGGQDCIFHVSWDRHTQAWQARTKVIREYSKVKAPTPLLIASADTPEFFARGSCDASSGSTRSRGSCATTQSSSSAAAPVARALREPRTPAWKSVAFPTGSLAAARSDPSPHVTEHVPKQRARL